MQRANIVPLFSQILAELQDPRGSAENPSVANSSESQKATMHSYICAWRSQYQAMVLKAAKEWGSEDGDGKNSTAQSTSAGEGERKQSNSFDDSDSYQDAKEDKRKACEDVLYEKIRKDEVRIFNQLGSIREIVSDLCGTHVDDLLAANYFDTQEFVHHDREFSATLKSSLSNNTGSLPLSSQFLRSPASEFWGRDFPDVIFLQHLQDRIDTLASLNTYSLKHDTPPADAQAAAINLFLKKLRFLPANQYLSGWFQTRFLHRLLSGDEYFRSASVRNKDMQYPDWTKNLRRSARPTYVEPFAALSFRPFVPLDPLFTISKGGNNIFKIDSKYKLLEEENIVRSEGLPVPRRRSVKRKIDFNEYAEDKTVDEIENLDLERGSKSILQGSSMTVLPPQNLATRGTRANENDSDTPADLPSVATASVSGTPSTSTKDQHSATKYLFTSHLWDDKEAYTFLAIDQLLRTDFIEFEAVFICLYSLDQNLMKGGKLLRDWLMSNQEVSIKNPVAKGRRGRDSEDGDWCKADESGRNTDQLLSDKIFQQKSTLASGAEREKNQQLLERLGRTMTARKVGNRRIAFQARPAKQVKLNTSSQSKTLPQVENAKPPEDTEGFWKNEILNGVFHELASHAHMFLFVAGELKFSPRWSWNVGEVDAFAKQISTTGPSGQPINRFWFAIVEDAPSDASGSAGNLTSEVASTGAAMLLSEGRRVLKLYGPAIALPQMRKWLSDIADPPASGTDETPAAYETRKAKWTRDAENLGKKYLAALDLMENRTRGGNPPPAIVSAGG